MRRKPTRRLLASFNFSLDTWYHVACVRSGNLVYLFVDGTLLNAGGTAFSKTIKDTTTTLKVGALEYDTTYHYYLNGWIDDLRITKGVGRYTADFTPPSAAYADVAGTGSYRQNGLLRFELESVRDDLISFQKHDWSVRRTGYGFNYGMYYGGV